MHERAHWRIAIAQPNLCYDGIGHIRIRSAPFRRLLRIPRTRQHKELAKVMNRRPDWDLVAQHSCFTGDGMHCALRHIKHLSQVMRKEVVQHSATQFEAVNPTVRKSPDGYIQVSERFNLAYSPDYPFRPETDELAG
jgi:hypothetical protein